MVENPITVYASGDSVGRPLRNRQSCRVYVIPLTCRIHHSLFFACSLMRLLVLSAGAITKCDGIIF